MTTYRFQIASDVVRDGLGVELVDKSHEPVAEVFRNDSKKSLFLNTFNNEIPLDALEYLLKYARYRLYRFEDGTPLSPASNFGQVDSEVTKKINEIADGNA